MASNTLPRGGVHHPALSSRAHAPTQSANIRPAQAQNVHIPHTSTSQSSIPPKRAVDALLPTCTIGRPLTETQVVNLSDMAGSLREVMLLAMRAKMDGSVMTELEGALGEAAAQGVVQFFENEFEF
ncbi:unnamed protein product [Periconia digitata]|uniref:Uncharacterized protein n=1 Tax=Periconia digitata TaxID=1303443 RepID=A0A9W4U9W2_9PLEO|nr:unnamed protein product [Periconia digitata]